MTGPYDDARGARGALADDELLRLCARGDSSALEEIVRRYQAPIYRLLYRLLGSAEDAEEAALDVFTRAWRHAGRFRFDASVSTWLYRIATNAARDQHARRRARPQQTPWPEAHQLDRLATGSAEADALVSLERSERASALERALARLSDGDRLLLVLYYLEERDYDEIAAITGCSYTVLKTRLARARRRLRSVLEAGDEEAQP